MTKFVIGIGSQRAGSTLLHKVLDECTDVFMHPIKELHYYDTLYGVRGADILVDFSRRQLDRELDRLIEAKGYGYIDKKYKCFLRANRILSSKLISSVDYFDLYRPCVADNEYLGEITPEYMILPEDGVSKLADDLGSDTKIILISRDPTERFISAFKLLKNYNNPNYDATNFARDLESTISDMPQWIRQQEELNDYEAALNRYQKYFSSVLFLSFEKMISDVDLFIVQLENFLSSTVDKEKLVDILGKKVNMIGETGNISDETRAQLDIRFEASKKYLDEVFYK
ncbi:sulfotransferase [Leucothrix mucor]|uniref:sulfotransferase n=1 Tax=Leucothrix mucor TaxID=45248 RepID=UPI0003B670B2|nr:sulfotransferase [Leucothrix mucor]